MQAPGKDRSSQQHILLVDDTRMGRLARKSVLVENGYKVTLTERPDQVLSLLDKDQFHLVVTNHKMTKMPGTELIAQLREAGFSIPVILMTAYADGLCLDEAKCGANLVIQKSANELSRLLLGVRTLLQPRKPANQVSGNSRKRRNG